MVFSHFRTRWTYRHVYTHLFLSKVDQLRGCNKYMFWSPWPRILWESPNPGIPLTPLPGHSSWPSQSLGCTDQQNSYWTHDLLRSLTGTAGNNENIRLEEKNFMASDKYTVYFTQFGLFCSHQFKKTSQIYSIITTAVNWFISYIILHQLYKTVQLLI